LIALAAQSGESSRSKKVPKVLKILQVPKVAVLSDQRKPFILYPQGAQWALEVLFSAL